MDWTRRSLIAASALLCAAPALAGADSDVYPLWEVRKGGATVFLFGDGGSTRDPWRSARIESAFDRSSVFWKETPDPAPGDAAKYLTRGVDRQRPLTTWLTPPQRDRVAAAAALTGANPTFVDNCEPWLAAGVLSMAYMAHQKPLPDPIAFLTAGAKGPGKPIHTEFPDLDALIAWMAGMPAVAQVEYLLSTIDDIEAGRDGLVRRVAAWDSGDISLEAKRVRRQMLIYPHVYESLDTARNRRWAPRIGEMLNGGGTTFVLVGADHLVGPESILAHLAQAGIPASRV